jgi:hypothetical protein
VAVGLCAVWFALHALWYATLLPFASLRDIRFGPGHTFFAQLAGFAAVLLMWTILRWRMMGRVCIAYLGLSAVVLLAQSRDPGGIASAVALLGWAVCAANSVRVAVRRVAPPLATWGVAAGIAYAALVPICFVLGILDGMSFWPVAAVAVALALPGAIDLAGRLPSLWRSLVSHLDRLGPVDLAILEVLWLLLAIGFVKASTEEVLSDSTRVHLPYIHEVALDHGLRHQYACWYRLQPMAVQTVEAAAYVLGSDQLAKRFSWLTLLGTLLVVVEEVHLRSRSRTLGLFAGAAVLGCPVFLILSSSLYVDHVLVFLCITAFVALGRALRPPALGGILLAALVMSSLMQAKYTGLIFCAVWGALLAIRLLWQCSWRRAVGWCLSAGALLAVASLPWYAWVYAGAGNPFYPDLNGWFHSPYWPEGCEMGDTFAMFRLRHGVWDVLFFPWRVTFRTSRFLEGYDGILGFWAVALLPCLLFVRRQRRADSWDLAIAGLLMIACVVAYTPYARYWLPAYALVVVSVAIALGDVFQGRMAERGPLGRAVSAVAVFIVLMLPLPLWACSLGKLPWEAYTHAMSGEQQRLLIFPGYPAIAELNSLLGPDEAVITSHFAGNHTIHGRAYEFVPWWNAIHGVHDVASFDEFCGRYHIRYWVVDHVLQASCDQFVAKGIGQRYWTDARRVAAYGSVAIYDLWEEHPAARLAKSHWEIPATLVKKGEDAPGAAATPGWNDQRPGTEHAAATAKGGIALSPTGQVGHRFVVPPGARHCRASLDVSSNPRGNVLAMFVWLDDKDVAVDRVLGSVLFSATPCAVQVYSPVPPTARTALLLVNTWGGEPMWLGRGFVEIDAGDADAPVVATRGSGQH